MELFKDEARGTCSFRRPDGTTWSVEELIGMQFMYIKQLAERESGERITEAVVTVSLSFGAPVSVSASDSLCRSHPSTHNSRGRLF